MEVISAKLNRNGTFSTTVDVSQLQSHHRRTRRSSKEIDLASFQSRLSHKVEIFSKERESPILSNGNASDAHSFLYTLRG